MTCYLIAVTYQIPLLRKEQPQWCYTEIKQHNNQKCHLNNISMKNINVKKNVE